MILIVYIKKVTMKGFKSYGNRKISVPLHRGFTCIVGPNGSGKSNIFDAVSFVLGRMSAKAMRAGSIADIVFAGTEKHRPAEYADVNIYFDNVGREFPIDKDEVIISRRVDKSGKSVYRFNNRRETRTYVVDMLNHAGMNPDGYNMVAQGDITRFIEMSSFERRMIIEEISGIQEYDEKKEKGLRELNKAEENVARVDLIIGEVRSSMDRLENEKNDALRYKHLKEEMTESKGKLIYCEIEENCKEQKEVEEEINRKMDEIVRLEKKSKELVEEIASSEKLLREKEIEFESKSEQEHLNILRQISSLNSSYETMGIRLEMKISSKNSLKQKMEDIQEQILQNENLIKEANGKIESLQGKLQEKGTEIELKEKEYSGIIESLEKTNNRFFEYKKESDEMEERIDKLKEKEYSLRNSLTSLEERLSAVKSRISTMESLLVEIEVDEVANKITGLEKKNKERQKRKSTLNINLLKSKELEFVSHIEAVEKKLILLRREFVELISRIGKKKESKEVYGRNANALDEILRLKEKGEVEGIIGKFSDLGTTKKDYIVALEVAAGSRMRNIVVENSDVARVCVKHLKKKKLGRVTFIPLSDIEPRHTPRRLDQSLSKNGAIDFAINLVNFKEEYRKAFEYVFSNTLVITDIDVSKHMPRWRMVTLDGDLIEPSGIITGGYWRPRRYLESFDTEEDEGEIKRLEKEISAHESRLTSLKSKLVETRKSISELSNEEAKLVAEIMADEDKLSELMLRLESLTSKKNSVILQIEKEEKSAREIEVEIEKKQKLLESFYSNLEIALNEKAKIDEKVDEYRSESVDKSQIIDDEVRQKRKERESILSQISYLESKVEVLILQNATARDKIKELPQKIEEISQETRELQNLREDTIAKIKLKKEEEAQITTQLEKIKKRRAQLRNQIGEMRDKKERSRERVSKLDSDIKVLELRKSNLIEKIDALKIESQHYKPPKEKAKDLKELRFRITQMEKEKEGLEPINMRAIEEFDEVEERYMALSTRRDKLVEERNSILRFIEEIESKKKDIFLSTFNVVQQNFSEIFEQLSPGGEGNLVLESEEDLFEGGLFIEARPPGKEIKRVESLSGGEKALTALAFVFAIQRYKPAPFYILDEIDAHLDDDNVRKVSYLIKNSSKSSQFIIITHRDLMMTTSDRLFGASVGKDKISKIVSVELERASDIDSTQRYGVAES
ncbi:MAG: chromosome segregation protein SMC [Candidatus Methanofastidiosia archaeon]